MASRFRALFALSAALWSAACAPVTNLNVTVKNALPGGKDDDDTAEEIVPYSPEWQRVVANHEAGHAVVLAYLFGVGAVKDLLVRTVSGRKGIAYAGFTHPMTGGAGFETKDDILRDMAMRLGGHAADVAVNGAAMTTVGLDLPMTTERAWSMCLSYGFCGTLVTTDKEHAPQSMRDQVQRFVDADADGCATAIIAANRDTITAIADALLLKEPNNEQRLLSGDEFRALLALHPLLPAQAGKVPLPSFCVQRP